MSVVDVARDSVVGAIAMGDSTRPVGVALSPDGRTLYVAKGRAHRMSVVDVAGGTVVADVAVGERPWGLAVSRDGRRVYTANGRSGTVSVVDASARQVTATIPVGVRPYTALVVP